MSTQKMLVVSLAKTKGVLGAATRTTSGVPAVTDLVGSGLVMHFQDPEASMIVPAEELEVKEADYSEDVFRAPLLHTIDGSGTVTAPTLKVSTISSNNTIAVTVTVLPATPAADKTVLVVIDPGPTHAPLTFVGKTVLNVAPTPVAVSDVPPGDHLVLASVDGYATLLDVCTFS